MAFDESSLDELLDVRIGLECYGVALAAERAVTEDMISLKQALSELTNGQLTQQEAKDADIHFHMAIAFATHNSVHIDLMWRFYNYMFHGVDELYSLLYEKNNTFRIIEKQHYKILEAIQCQDAKNSKRYMLQHIAFLQSFLPMTDDL
jgi:DNA-binding FadR family transcriptional regulator